MTDFNTKNPFKIPENYFKNLEDSLLKNAKSISYSHGFTIPKDYFNTLEEDILHKAVKSNSFSRHKIALGIATIAATLAVLLNLSSIENSETIIEDQAFNDYIESYYLDNSDGYEILSMLEEIDMGQDFEDYNKKPK